MVGNIETENALTERTAQRALEKACRQAGLDAGGAELIRIGSNAAYRLREPVIVCIARDPTATEGARKQVTVARWLESRGYPATRALGVEQPVEADGCPATFWASASEREEYASIDQVAEVLRRLHELDAPGELALPEKQPFDDINGRLPNLTALDADDAQFLRERVDELRERYAQLEFELALGMIHGDANVGNVILDRNGQALLIDLDSFCTGPREWEGPGSDGVVLRAVRMAHRAGIPNVRRGLRVRHHDLGWLSGAR